MGETGDERVAVEGFEFVELAAVRNAGNDFAHFERVARVGGNHAVDFCLGVSGGTRRQQRQLVAFDGVQIADDAARDAQCVGVVFGQVIGDAAGAGVQLGAAQILGADHLARGGAHQGGAGQEDGALVAHDDGLVAHGRHIGTAGGAAAHDDRDLGDAFGGHLGLVVEDAAEMVAIGNTSSWFGRLAPPLSTR